MDIKKLGLIGLVAVVLVGGGYAAGRYATPEKVVVTEKIKEVEKVVVVRVVETEKIVDALKNVVQQKNVHTKKVTVKQPDGTVTTTTETDDKTKTDSQDKTHVDDKTKTAETKTKEIVVEKEVTKLVERNRPSWRLGLQTGFDVAALAGSTQPFSLLPSNSDLVRYLVLGVSVEHRLVGPLSTGVWASTRGMGGISLSLEF